MSGATELYLATLVTYCAVYMLACLGLNLQLGFTGIVNFAQALFQAAGAYTAGILLLGPPTGGFVHYIGGPKLPVVPAFACAAVVGGVLCLLFGFVTQRGGLRRDYQALLWLILMLIALDIATQDGSIVNGSAGIAGVPQPLQGGLPSAGGALTYACIILVVAFAIYLALAKATKSPWGRLMRAVREGETAVSGLGLSVRRIQFWPLVIGGALAGLSGAFFVGYLGSWSTAGWQPAETFSFLGAIIVGGLGSNTGAVLGAIILPVALSEVVRFLPALGYPGLTDSLQWIAIGALWIAFMWWRPRGIVPEAKRFVDWRSQLKRLQASGVSGTKPANTQTLLGSGSSSSHEAIPSNDVRPPQRTGGTRLSISGVSKYYSGVCAVRDVSLEVRDGQIVGLIGPNGAGKTTLLSLISGSVPMSEGSVSLDARKLPRNALSRIARRGVVRTAQVPQEFGKLTVLENMLAASPKQRGTTPLGALAGKHFWWGQTEEGRVRQAAALLDMVGLLEKADDLAEELSGGQKKLLELVRAVMAEPRILLLDEPTAGVNPRYVEKVIELIVNLKRQGMGIVMVEHELGVISRICDAVVVMAQGEVIAEGGYDHVIAVPAVQEAYVVGG